MPSSSAQGAEGRLATAAGAGCYLMWGVIPLLFQLMGHMGVSAWEIMANRIVWGTPTALLFVLAARQWPELMAAFRKPRVMAWLALTTVLIAGNWSLFIWAVNSGRVLETSLGYYINPLIAMAGGALVFRERIDRIGQIAIGLAVIGIAIQTAAIGRLPVVSLALALSFGGYGVVRKLVPASAQTGLFIECLFMIVPAVAYMLWLQTHGAGHLGAAPATTFWLVACGPITIMPLLMFSWSARRIPLSVLGFLQFITPTITFVIGTRQGEAFTPLRAASFVFIWGGAAVFTWGAWRRSRSASAATVLAEPA